MSVIADLTEEERYLFAILQDQSGIDQAEFSWTDDTSSDFVFRCWDFQYPWYRTRAKFQIDQCVAEGELVLTRRGHVPIEEVVVGDEVWTHRNRWRKVTYTWDKGEQAVVRVTSPLNSVGITLTPDHKLWTRGGTRKMVAGEGSLHATEPDWRAPQDFQERSGETYATMIASPFDFGCTSEVPEVERLPRCNRDTIPSAYDEDFMWLCGIYVAEGTVRQSGAETVLSVHRDEAELVAKTARKVGLSPRSYAVTEMVTQVILPGRSLAAWLQEYFGKLAHGKRLPTWALSSSTELRQALLDGLMFGDGHIRATRRSESLVGEYTTVSKALALDVKLLMQSLGRGANIRYARRAGQMQIQGRTVNVRDTYVVSQFVEGSRKNRIALVDEHMWGSYYDAVPAGRSRVYDLEVEEDHSFIAGGIAHSNCARAIGKSVGIQMRAWAFAFTNPGEHMLVTAPEMIHLDPVTKNIEDRIMSTRLSREFLKKSGTSNGITHRPFEARFRNGSRIIGRIPQKDGRGVKGQHPKKLEMDEAQDYPEPGWVELGETLKYGEEDATWRAHGVSRGVRDRYYKQTQPESGWFVHKITAMHRPDWTAGERAAKAELYGSRDHPDYRRNILGLHGDASSALFVLTRLMQCVDQDQSSHYNMSEYYHCRINDEKLRDTQLPIQALLDFPAGHKAYERTWVGMDVGMCADEATEIFTQRGWLGLDQVQAGDRTLSIDEKDGRSYWTPIDSVHVFDDSGEGQAEWDMVAMRGQTLDALVTPRHRWLVRDYRDRLTWKTTMELTSKDQVPYAAPRGDLPLAPTHKDDLVKLAAWYFTEGSVNNKGSLSICQSGTSNSDYVEMIRDLLTRLYGRSGDVFPGPQGRGGPLWSEKVRTGARTGHLRDDDVMHYFHLSAVIRNELTELVVGSERVPSPEFLASLTEAQLAAFVTICGFGDGWEQAGRQLFQQNSEARTRAYEYACTLLGMAVSTKKYSRVTNVRGDVHDYWHTGVLNRRVVAPVGAAMQARRGSGQMVVEKRRYKGRVWCPKLSRGNWLARRNGSIYFTGNTNHPSEILIMGEEYPQSKTGGHKAELPNMRLKTLARIHLERIKAPDQRAVLEAVWDFYRPQAIAMDRTGLGLPIFQEIVEARIPGFSKAMRGYNFSEKIVIGYEDVPDDEMVYDPDDLVEIKANVLEYSSDMLRLYVDQRQLLLPWDIDMLREFQGQTYVVSKSNTDAYGKKQFNKGKFHALDAARMAILGHLQEKIDAMRAVVVDEPVYDMFLIG